MERKGSFQLSCPVLPKPSEEVYFHFWVKHWSIMIHTLTHCSFYGSEMIWIIWYRQFTSESEWESHNEKKQSGLLNFHPKISPSDLFHHFFGSSHGISRYQPIDFSFLDHKNVTRIKSSYTTVLNIWILWFLKKLESFRNLVCKPFKPNEIKNFLFVNEKGLFLARNTAHLFSRFFKFQKWPPNDWTRYSFYSPRSWFGFDFIKVISRVDALIVGTGETVVVMNLVATHW